MTLEQRVAHLESKLAALMPNPQTINVESIQARTITLKSAKNESSIVMLTQSTGAGIWISRGQKDGSVAMYNMANQGPVVGIHGPHNKKGLIRRGMDTALFHTEQDGGMLQMSDNHGTIHQISTADILAKQNSGISSYHSILSE